MKYQLSTFNSETRYYTRHLAKHRGKSMLIVVPRFTKESFLAIAPLSRAAHELGKDVKVVIPNGNSKALEVLEDVWACYEDLKRGKTNPQTKALARFIKLVSKKIEHFEEIFKRPSIIVYATPQGFKLEEQYLQYKHQWFKPYRRNALRKTCRLVWDKVFALKQSEVVDCKFELVPTRERLELPLEDYLNNFAIMLAMVGTCPGKPRLSSATPRASQLAKPERVSELIATLSGCELDKDIPDPVFKAYKKLSELLGLARLKPGDAIFAISGKGYYGLHAFGEKIGYPTKNRKSRWQSPTQMMLKLPFYPQTAHEERPPLTRIGFTETLPIDVFIQSCNIDWDEMRKRNLQLQKLIQGCDKLEVTGKPLNGKSTNLVVYIKSAKRERSIMLSDGDARTKIDTSHFRKTGIKAGRMANIPAGEVFFTPESIEGVFVGDVVIAIDQSYKLNPKKPLVIKAKEGFYQVVDGDTNIIKKLNKKKRESWRLLLEQEKHGSAPKRLIQLKKRNFNRIGEFAINTNPKAKLCDYLIVNEKIAHMIHIALGSGFEPDRATSYHMDIVIDAKRQRLNIVGVKGNKRVWIMKQGRLVA